MIAREFQAPNAPSIALEGMKAPAWDRIQFRNILGFLDGSQHRAQLSLMLSRNSARLVMPTESLDLPVSETDDAHMLYCTLSPYTRQINPKLMSVAHDMSGLCSTRSVR